MTNYYPSPRMNIGLGSRLTRLGVRVPRSAAIGVVLLVALLAFELFNFDTTRFALRNLMGDVEFLGFQWAGILAIAFCSIDFAGLVRLFTPERGRDEPKEVWYLMGAWLLGATMNALMTWWAISLTLLNHDFGNEVLSRHQLLTIVPVFVAVLVWLTRILFIGASTVAGERIFNFHASGAGSPKARPSANARYQSDSRASVGTAASSRQSRNLNTSNSNNSRQNRTIPSVPQRVAPNRGSSRIRQRPPIPSSTRRMPLNGIHAKPFNQN